MTDRATVTVTDNGGSSHVGEAATTRFAMIAVRQGLRARKIGMQVNRAYTTKNCLAFVTRLTGKTYTGATKLDDAITDLTAEIEKIEQRIDFVDERTA